MDRAGFEDKLKFLAKEIQKNDNFALVYHHDVDGITSGAIIGTVLKRAGKDFNSKCIKQLYSDTVEEIKDLGNTYLFCDFGAGQLDYLKEKFGDNFFVLDHHQPIQIDHSLQLNPFEFGINGAREICSAGLSYFFGKTISPENKDLSVLAIVGAVGDMQDSSGKLEGLNREILKDAIEQNLLQVDNDLRLYGRISRPLTQFLAYSTSPVIPQITASEENASAFLRKIGIELKNAEQWRSYSNLSPEEQKKLCSSLIVHLHNFNVPEWKIESMIGEVYTLLKEPEESLLRDAKEFGTLCNSCGRHGKGEIAFEVCMGDRDNYLQTAISLLQEHRRHLRSGIEFVQEKGIQEKDCFYYFDAQNEIKETLVGIVAGMLYGSGLIANSKPVVGLASSGENEIKVSTRTTQELVRQGMNLGLALRNVCTELGEGAEGGGHSIAAGCKIPAKEKENFLEKLNQQLLVQLRKKDN